jgi:hypothetical protein
MKDNTGTRENISDGYFSFWRYHFKSGYVDHISVKEGINPNVLRNGQHAWSGSMVDFFIRYVNG